jgi:hypothetical protein
MDYRHIQIEWQLNIGMPARSCDNENLCNWIKLIALMAWNLTLVKGASLNVLDFGEARKKAQCQIDGQTFDQSIEQLHPEYVVLIPEVIAEVIGYIRSPMKRYGMFLIVDVGAATMDVASFAIDNKNGEEFFAIPFARVEKLGAYILHMRRISMVNRIFPNQLKTPYEFYDGISPLPELEDYLKEPTKKYIDALNAIDAEFRRECEPHIEETIRFTLARKHLLTFDWKEGCPVFLCGGGAKARIYFEMLKKLEMRLNRLGFRGFDFQQIPKPDNLEAPQLLKDEFNRMAVAYGLSFSKDDIGECIAPSEMVNWIIIDKEGRAGVRKRREPIIKEQIQQKIKHVSIEYYTSRRKDEFDYFDDYSSVKD